MKFAFHTRAPHLKQRMLAEAIEAGAVRAGDQVQIVEGFTEVLDVDGIIMLGIGGLDDDHARLPFDAYKQAGKVIVFLDKGYTRNDNFRVAVNDFQPLAYLMRDACPSDRFRDLRITIPQFPKVSGRRHILFDGASEKYCAWKGFGTWADWGAEVVRKIKDHTDLPVIYRPRPGRNGVPVVPGAISSQESLDDDLLRARVVVSYGGNIGWDAVIRGVPHFAIGDSIARPVSETDWVRVGMPFAPKFSIRYQWALNVAYCQWSLQEFANGSAWRYVKSKM